MNADNTLQSAHLCDMEWIYVHSEHVELPSFAIPLWMHKRKHLASLLLWEVDGPHEI